MTEPRTFDPQLLLGLIAYVVINLFAVMLVMEGIVHPPWNTLLFFIFAGPGLGTLLLLATQACCVPRPFSWAVVFVVVGVLVLAALLNVQIFALANAAV